MFDCNSVKPLYFAVPALVFVSAGPRLQTICNLLPAAIYFVRHVNALSVFVGGLSVSQKEHCTNIVRMIFRMRGFFQQYGEKLSLLHRVGCNCQKHEAM